MFRGDKWILLLLSVPLKGKNAKSLIVLLAAKAFLSLAFLLGWVWPQSSEESKLPIGSEIAAMDLNALRKQIAIMEKKLQELSKKTERLFPAGTAILIDSAVNQIYLAQGSKIVVKDRCSTGTGFELTDESGKRTWTFDTPRGYFKVVGKVKDPVWYRPDWAFIEEGEPIPKNRAERAVADVLGDYAISFGNGYFIHGTLYTRMLGTSVTHGCIRVADDTLQKIYNAVQIGSPIWIY